jgi:hypothetical protein
VIDATGPAVSDQYRIDADPCRLRAGEQTAERKVPATQNFQY